MIQEIISINGNPLPRSISIPVTTVARIPASLRHVDRIAISLVVVVIIVDLHLVETENIPFLEFVNNDMSYDSS